MLIYKDRKLNVENSLIQEYNDVRGRALDERDINIYVHAAYSEESDDPQEYIKSISDDELSETIAEMIKSDIFVHS